jgi:hypothetical protein
MGIENALRQELPLEENVTPSFKNAVIHYRQNIHVPVLSSITVYIIHQIHF